MSPKIEATYPPNFELIVAAFPDAARPGVVFAYGDTIYNPGGNPLALPILAHEAAHCECQGNPEEWWDLYIRSTQFRYEQELLGHAAEYRAQMQLVHNDRNRKAQLLMSTAQRLLAPLYNYGGAKPSLQQALLDLTMVSAL